MTRSECENTAIRIRQGTPDDWKVVAGFNQAMAVETEGKSLRPELIEAGVLAALSDPARALYFLAEVSGQIAGQTMITTEWSDWRNGFFWWIQSVYVAPEFRRVGVFRALHGHIRAEARRRSGVCGIRLYAHHENARALKVYEQLGMSRTDYLLLEEDWSR